MFCIYVLLQMKLLEELVNSKIIQTYLDTIPYDTNHGYSIELLTMYYRKPDPMYTLGTYRLEIIYSEWVLIISNR